MTANRPIGFTPSPRPIAGSLREVALAYRRGFRRNRARRLTRNHRARWRLSL